MRTLLLRLGVIAIVWFGLIAGAGAMIAPWYFAPLQRAAPEALVLKVLSVRTHTRYYDQGVEETRVDARARVQKVLRSASRLKPGTIITIGYISTYRPFVYATPRTPGVLERGEVVTAYLRRAGRNYAPAARHVSFGAVSKRPGKSPRKPDDDERPPMTRSPSLA